MEIQEIRNLKVYVDVVAAFNSCGALTPLKLTWEDGREYEIDQVTDIRQAAAMKAGGQGDRYTIVVNGRSSYLFFERSASIRGNIIGRFFVERRTG